MPSERKNPDFYRAVKEYVLRAHQILKEPYELKKSLGQIAERLDLPINPFFLLIVENLEKIKDTEEYENCLSLAQSDETISKHLDKLVRTVHTTRLRLNSENLMTNLLLWFTNDSTLSHFELNTFNSLYHKVENFLYSDWLKVSVVSSLWLFNVGFALAVNLQNDPLSWEGSLKFEYETHMTGHDSQSLRFRPWEKIKHFDTFYSVLC